MCGKIDRDPNLKRFEKSLEGKIVKPNFLVGFTIFQNPKRV
jgi:hypothetical protein